MQLPCRRCGRPVVSGAADYDTFEQMHYVCFHYEFEHHGDPDVECATGGCPASGPGLAPVWVRVSGVDLLEDDDAVVPAILALEACGYTVVRDGNRFAATAGDARFTAQDPVALLGLVRLAEIRRPWRATESEVDDVVSRHYL